MTTSEAFRAWCKTNHLSIDKMKEELQANGWKQYNHPTVYLSPEGHCFRGPAFAYWVMLKTAVIPVTEAEVAKFMDECDRGLHPLTPADHAALEKARLKFYYHVRKMFRK